MCERGNIGGVILRVRVLSRWVGLLIRVSVCVFALAVFVSEYIGWLFVGNSG